MSTRLFGRSDWTDPHRLRPATRTVKAFRTTALQFPATAAPLDGDYSGMKPILYVKAGCPYCSAAMKYLDERQIGYEKVDVRGSDSKMKKLQDLSRQTKAPTLDWNGEVLADFGVEELKEFLKGKVSA